MPRRNSAPVVMARRLPRAVHHNLVAEYGVGVTHDPNRCRCGRH